jgi:hypothetical protein
MGRAPQTVLQNYEPVYIQPNETQNLIGKPIGKQPAFDDEAYAIHTQGSKGAVAQIMTDSESKSHTSTVKEETSTVPHYGKNHTQTATAESDTHFYIVLKKQTSSRSPPLGN